MVFKYFPLLLLSDTFMVEDAVEAIGFGTFQWKLSILTGLSWVRTSLYETYTFAGLMFPCVDLSVITIRLCFLFAQMADAMEMMILSILAPQLHCEWRLPSLEVALLTSVMSLVLHDTREGTYCVLGDHFEIRACFE